MDLREWPESFSAIIFRRTGPDKTAMQILYTLSCDEELKRIAESAYEDLIVKMSKKHGGGGLHILNCEGKFMLKVARSPYPTIEIPGYPGFFITPYGQVFSSERKDFEIKKASNGYRRVYIGGKTKNIHALVLLAFRGPKPSPKHVAAHNNGNKDDCRITNLRWATYSENILDRAIHSPYSWAKSLSKSEVDIAVAMRSEGESLRAIGRRLNVSHGVIRQIFNGKSYKYWTGIKTCSRRQ